MDMTNQLTIFVLGTGLLVLAWIVSILIFIVCSFKRGIGWGILCLFTGYIGGLIAVLVPGENKPVRSFLSSVVIFILLILAMGGGGYYFSKEIQKYVVIDQKLFIRENGQLKELPPAQNQQEEIFRQTLTEIISQSGGQSLDPDLRAKKIELTPPAIPASAFEITAIMGEEGTQNFNVMFNNNMDYSADVGESFTYDYQGRKVEVTLKEVTAKDVILVADGHEIKVPRERKSAVVVGDSTAVDPAPASAGQVSTGPLSASAFRITAMMGTEGTQDFNVMFNHNMDYSVDVGESFTFDYQGRKIPVTLKEVTARDVVLVADGREIRVSRSLHPEAVEGDPKHADSGETKSSDYRGGTWLTSYPQALKVAQQMNRPILLVFTGSDWCPPCMKLEREVFSTTAFLNYSRDNFILLKADFPRTRQLPPDQQKANDALASQFGVKSFPSVFLLTPQGIVKGEKMGAYQGDNLNIYLEAMKKFKAEQGL